jgi:type II secretory pathway component PulJ
MKNNQLTAMLVGLLFLSTLGSIALIMKYNSSFRDGQRLDPALKEINEIQRITGLLANETVEYSKTTKNPDMARLLQSINTAKPAAAAKPATK